MKVPTMRTEIVLFAYPNYGTSRFSNTPRNEKTSPVLTYTNKIFIHVLYIVIHVN